MLWLFLAFIVLPVLEIWILTQVAGQIGWPLALFLVIAVSAAGAMLVKREGLGVIRRLQESVQAARLPTNELADGAMIFFASALMLTPGFLTDAVGLALLIPPIRAVIRPPLISYFRRRVDVRIGSVGGSTGGFGTFGGSPFGPGPGRGSRPGGDDVIDVDGHSASDHPPTPDPEIEPPDDRP